MIASDIFVFFCRGDSMLSRAIMRITGGEWSHCGIGFITDQGPVYYEALFGRNFAGPRPMSKLLWWAEQSPHRAVTAMTLDVDSVMAQDKLLTTERMVGVWGYAEWQLLAMFAAERLGWAVPRSEKRVVCSEAVARILNPQIVLTDRRHPTLDSITPSSLHAALAQWLVGREERRTMGRLRVACAAPEWRIV